MIKHYSYIVKGRAANNQTWESKGTVKCEFEMVFTEVTMNAFYQLTHGKAIYGKPGLGCNGPYEIDKIIIEQIKH